MQDQVFITGLLGADRDGVLHLMWPEWCRWAEETIPPSSCFKSAKTSLNLSLPHLVPISREFQSISSLKCFEI